MIRAGALAAALLLAACAARPPPPVPAPIPGPVPAPPPATMLDAERARLGIASIAPDQRWRNLIRAVEVEWDMLGRLTVDLRPDGRGSAGRSLELGPRLRAYWTAAGRSELAHGDAPWSAAFIAWAVEVAGVPASEFPRETLHFNYLLYFWRGASTRFTLEDPVRYAPAVGDLVCFSRDRRAAGLPFLAPERVFRGEFTAATHCDLVVETQPGRIAAVGGNVSGGVALTLLPTDPRTGRIAAVERRPWFAVVRNRYRPAGPMS